MYTAQLTPVIRYNIRKHTSTSKQIGKYTLLPWFVQEYKYPWEITQDYKLQNNIHKDSILKITSTNKPHRSQTTTVTY